MKKWIEMKARMRRSEVRLCLFTMAIGIYALMFAYLATSAVAQTLNPTSHCGTERWHIKTLDDAGASAVSNQVQTVAIGELVALPIPTGYSRNNDTQRYAPTEDTIY